MKTLLALGLWMGMLLGAQGGERQAVFAGLEVAKHLHGDEVTPEDLVGKVVFLEYWGVRCPPCRASFPHLVAMQKKHGGSGKFTVLASHVQDGPEAAADFCREQGANFPVYQQLREPAAPCPGGIPHAAIIDHEGTVVATGHPMQLLEQVDDIVKRVPERYPMLGGMTVRHWTAHAKRLGKDKPAKPVLAQLRLAASKGTDAKATEAGEMAAAIEAYLVAEQARLSALVNDRPARAYLDLQNLRRAIAGLEGEKEVAALATDLQGNPVVLRLAGLLKKADEIQGKIKAKPSRALTQQLAQVRKQIKGIGDADATSVGAEAKAAAEALPE